MAQQIGKSIEMIIRLNPVFLRRFNVNPSFWLLGATVKKKLTIEYALNFRAYPDEYSIEEENNFFFYTMNTDSAYTMLI